jgi:hypothetical protein
MAEPPGYVIDVSAGPREYNADHGLVLGVGERVGVPDKGPMEKRPPSRWMGSAFGHGRCRPTTRLGNTKAGDKVGDCHGNVAFHADVERVSWGKGANHDHHPQATSIPGTYLQSAECSCCREGG